MTAPPESYPRLLIDDRFDGRRVEKAGMRFGRAETLAELASWKFFTPAMLYLFAKFDDEAIARYNDTLGRELVLGHYRFKRRIFRGLVAPNGDAEWDHVLWCCPLEDWDGFENYLISLIMVDYGDRTTYGVGAQDIVVCDPLYFDRKVVLPAEIPVIEVTVLGVNGSRQCIAMDVAGRAAMDCPQVKRYPPQRKPRLFAEALFGKDAMAAMDHLTLGTNYGNTLTADPGSQANNTGLPEQRSRNRGH